MSVFEYAVALTGGIATGKSTAAKHFASWGFEIIDLDAVAHQVLESRQEEIAACFGAECIREGSVDRRRLGQLVFADRDKRKVLESLLHPLIREEAERSARRLDSIAAPYLVDIPLFFELKSYPISRSIVVYAPKDLQLQRLIEREGYTEAEALQRIAAQVDIEEKKREADFVIDNSGDLLQLQNECERVRDLILS